MFTDYLQAKRFHEALGADETPAILHKPTNRNPIGKSKPMGRNPVVNDRSAEPDPIGLLVESKIPLEADILEMLREVVT